MHKLKLEVIKYEQKYSFIDIDKLQEEIASWKTLYDEQLERSTVLQIDLFEIRERIMDLTQKFDKGLKKRDIGVNQWKAGEDAENLCRLLTNHMTNPNYFGRQPPEEQMVDGILDDGLTKAHIDL